MNLRFQSAIPAMQVTQVLCVQKHCLSDSVLPELENLGHCFPSSVVHLPRSLLKRSLDSTPQLLHQKQGKAESRATVALLTSSPG